MPLVFILICWTLHKENNMGQDNIPRLVVRIAVPSMLAQFISVLYSIVDRMFVGNIPDSGDLALAGVGGGRRQRRSGEESSQVQGLLPLLHTLAWRGTGVAGATGRSTSALAPLAAALQRLSRV